MSYWCILSGYFRTSSSMFSAFPLDAALSQFVINASHFVITVAFCNKKPDAFCNKIISTAFVIMAVAFSNKLRIKYETVALLTTKIRFPMLMLCPMFFNPLSLDSGASIFSSLSLDTPERDRIFTWNLNHADKTSLETFWLTQIGNLKYLTLTIALVSFLTFCCFFCSLFSVFY